MPCHWTTSGTCWHAFVQIDSAPWLSPRCEIIPPPSLPSATASRRCWGNDNHRFLTPAVTLRAPTPRSLHSVRRLRCEEALLPREEGTTEEPPVQATGPAQGQDQRHQRTGTRKTSRIYSKSQTRADTFGISERIPTSSNAFCRPRAPRRLPRPRRRVNARLDWHPIADPA